ncbi:MAG: hypothetical protein LQ338_004666 [Usnochroma carphineum]|nr:MAG: hypothetical protein LQ338_004666 [Usnochroma carphineum]
MAPLPPTQRQKANIKLPFQRRWVLPTRPLTHKSYPRHLSLKPSRFAWPDPPNLISPIHDIFAAPSRQLGPRKPEANIGPRFLKHRARPKPLHCGLKSGRRVRGDVEMGDEVLNRVSEVGIEVEDLAVRSAVQWGVLEGLREEIAGEMDLDLVGDEEEVDYYDQDSEMGDGSEADGDNEQGGHDDNGGHQPLSLDPSHSDPETATASTPRLGLRGGDAPSPTTRSSCRETAIMKLQSGLSSRLDVAERQSLHELLRALQGLGEHVDGEATDMQVLLEGWVREEAEREEMQEEDEEDEESETEEEEEEEDDEEEEGEVEILEPRPGSMVFACDDGEFGVGEETVTLGEVDEDVVYYADGEELKDQ